MIKIWKDEINQLIDKYLKELLPQHEFKEVIRYSVLPAGKLFRPLIIYNLAKDLGEITEDHKRFAVSIELHHSYTLIHDDLPSMDNDDFRRGRPSSHKKFNEWKAILAGDALLNLSYQLLAKITPSSVSSLLELYTLAMGPKGLILGQVMDLSNENQTLENILKIHELKTVRLIQLSLQGANILSENKLEMNKINELAYALGINFQLLDDLCELSEQINQHEKEINPFLNHNVSELFRLINNNYNTIKTITSENKLNNLSTYLDTFFTKISNLLVKDKNKIEQLIDYKLDEFIDKIK